MKPRFFILLFLILLNIPVLQLVSCQPLIQEGRQILFSNKVHKGIKREIRFKIDLPLDFAELFQNDHESKIFKKSLLENIMFYPKWTPNLRSTDFDFSCNNSGNSLQCYYNSGYYKVSLLFGGDGLVRVIWDYYGFDFGSLVKNSVRYKEIADRYKIGWFWYLAGLRTNRIKDSIENFVKGDIEKRKSVVRKNRIITSDDINKWGTVFVDQSVDDLIIRIPLDIKSSINHDSGYFVKVLSLDEDLGLLSRVIPAQIIDEEMYIKIPLRTSEIIVEKMFHIGKEGRSVVCYEKYFPFAVSNFGKVVSKYRINEIIQLAKQIKIFPTKILPKALVATMGQHTNPVFAVMVGNSVYPTDNGADIFDYFSPRRAVYAVKNLETIPTQGASVIQIAYVGEAKDEEEICETFVRAARLCVEAGAGAVEINMCGLVGMPKGGARLMENPDLCGEIVRRVVRNIGKEVPVLVKMRLGINRNNMNVVDIARIVCDAGASAITVLAQTADMKFNFPYDYSLIKQVKATVNIPIIVNGGIYSPQQAKEVLKITGADAVSIGRACVGDPGLIKRVINYLESGELLPPPSALESLNKARKYLRLLHKYYGRDFKFDIYMKDFLSGYLYNIISSMPVEMKILFIETALNINNEDEFLTLLDIMEKNINEIIEKRPLKTTN